MSLLLQALQKAAKSREESEVDLSAVDALAMADELELEPTPSAPRSRQDSPASPTSAQAATLVQAGNVPAFDPLEYAREHYMLTFVGVAFLLAAAYGTYVYIQVNKLPSQARHHRQMQRSAECQAARPRLSPVPQQVPLAWPPNRRPLPRTCALSPHRLRSLTNRLPERRLPGNRLPPSLSPARRQNRVAGPSRHPSQMQATRSRRS